MKSRQTHASLRLTNYGLGSPFVDHSKLCAALNSFWRAVAPDITRAVTLQPPRDRIPRG